MVHSEKLKTLLAARTKETVSMRHLRPLRTVSQKVRAFRGMNNIQAMKAFMLLGDLSTKQGNELSDEAVAYKERIAFATMRASIPDWQPPKNWNELTNKQKLDRLDKLQSV